MGYLENYLLKRKWITVNLEQLFVAAYAVLVLTLPLKLQSGSRDDISCNFPVFYIGRTLVTVGQVV